MQLLFKSADVSTPQIKDTNFKAHYPDANGNTTWSDLTPRIRQATLLYILPYLGKDFYNALAAEYNSETEITGEKLEILERLQDAIAHYTIYTALPYMPFVIASAGFQKQQPPEGVVAPSLGERMNTRWNAHIDADRYLDEALKELEATTDNYFDDYHTHAAENFKTTAFFKQTSQLDNHINIQQSRRAFAALTPHLRKAEGNSILPILGKDLFEKLAGNTLEDTEKELLEIVRRIVANQGLAEAVPYLTLIVESDGFKVVSKGDGVEERSSLKSKEHENAILRLRDAALQTAIEAKKDLLVFLWKNKGDLAGWLNSDYYIQMTTGDTKKQIISTGNGGIFL